MRSLVNSKLTFRDPVTMERLHLLTYTPLCMIANAAANCWNFLHSILGAVMRGQAEKRRSQGGNPTGEWIMAENNPSLLRSESQPPGEGFQLETPDQLSPSQWNAGKQTPTLVSPWGIAWLTSHRPTTALAKKIRGRGDLLSLNESTSRRRADLAFCLSSFPGQLDRGISATRDNVYIAPLSHLQRCPWCF